MTRVVMPKLGNSVETSLIVTWLKRVGDRVERGEALCSIETDKAVMDVESPIAGTLLKTYFEEGDEVPVLVTIAAIGEPDEIAPAPDTAPQVSPTTEPQMAAPLEPPMVESSLLALSDSAG